MKQLYTQKPKREIVFKSNYFGYDFIVISYGTHPCGYVRIPEDSKIFNWTLEEIKKHVRTHGGVNFFQSLGHIDKTLRGTRYIGWSYDLADDYNAHYAQYEGYEEYNFKKHSVAEIIIDCKKVILQLLTL